MTIKLNQPVMPDLAKLTPYLAQVNDSGWYTNFGSLHQELTSRLEKYLEVENLLLVANGTLALQVAYKTLKIKHAITTPFTFVATSSSLIWQGINASYADINRDSCNLDPASVAEALQQDASIDAIVATHVYGNPCDIDAFDSLAKKNKCKLIYDAAHAFGVKVNGESILKNGDASILSFHATKLFHCLEGGAIIFKRRTDYEEAKRLINFGFDTSNGEIVDLGINAKLNEYQCAVGLTLLDDIDQIMNKRRTLFEYYRETLSATVAFPRWHKNATFNGAYMPIIFATNNERQSVMQALTKHQVQYRAYFSPSLDDIFKEQKVFSNKNSQALSQTILCLPLHFYMTIDDIDIITKEIKKAVQ